MKTKFLTLILIVMVLFSGCADNTPCSPGLWGGELQKDPTLHEYGFWGGLWHGYIAPIDFIGSLIWDDVTVHAQSNNGHWYDFGFVLGFGGFAGLGATVSKTRRRR